MVPSLRAFGLAVLALGLATVLDLRLAEQALSRPYDVLYVPNSAATRVAAMGQRLLVSDLHWLSAVQYIGEDRAAERGWDKLLPLLELVTDLDPRHGYAYQTGGIVLSVAGRLDESDAILKKGIEKGPPYWTFGYYLAFNAWFYRGDYAAGARWAEVAARTKGAPPSISQLALSLAAKNGTPEQAIRLLGELKETVKDQAIADRLDEQLRLAVLERDAQALERVAARFRAERGRPIASLQELLWNGYLRRLPDDPFGGEYTWDRTEQRVHSTANAFRFSARQGPQVEPRVGGEIRSEPPQSGARREEPHP